MTYSTPINDAYLERVRAIGLPTKVENNSFLVIHLYGNGIDAPRDFNVKVYRKKGGRLTLVSTSKEILDRLISKVGKIPEQKESNPRIHLVLTDVPNIEKLLQGCNVSLAYVTTVLQAGIAEIGLSADMQYDDNRIRMKLRVGDHYPVEKENVAESKLVKYIAKHLPKAKQIFEVGD